MDFDTVFGQGTDVTNIVLIAVEELDERLRFGEFSDLSLVDPLPELAHMELSIILARARSPGFFWILVGSRRRPSRA